MTTKHQYSKRRAEKVFPSYKIICELTPHALYWLDMNPILGSCEVSKAHDPILSSSDFSRPVLLHRSQNLFIFIQISLFPFTTFNMGPGKGCSQEETTAAWKGYVASSEDPQKRNWKKKDVFDAQVLKQYQIVLKAISIKKNHGTSYVSCSADAVMEISRKVLSASLKFEGNIASFKARNTTDGPRDDDI